MDKLSNTKLLFSSILLAFSLVGCDSKVSVTTTTNSNNSDSSSSSTSVSVNDNTITTIEEKSSSFSQLGNIMAIGSNSVVVKNNKAYLNGKEIELDTSNGISIDYVNNQQLINGKPIKYKDSKDTSVPLNVEVSLSGQLVKVPVSSLSNINSSFNIEQQCSSGNESYYMIDSALQPYLVDNHDGSLRLKEGKYKIKGKLLVTLFTPALDRFNYNSSGSLSLSCLDKKSFTLENSGIGSVVMNNVATNLVNITQSGVGNISINGEFINQLYATNSGVGTLNFNVKIKEGHVENSGVGNIKAKEIVQLDAINSGIGSIDVDKSDKVVRSENNSMGHIYVNKSD